MNQSINVQTNKAISNEEYEYLIRQLELQKIITLESTEYYSNFNQESSIISYSISMTNRIMNKKVIPLVNSINKQSTFINSQIQIIKSLGGKFDNKTQYWYLTIF